MSRMLDGQRVSDITYCVPCFDREARPAGTDWEPDDCPLYGTCPDVSRETSSEEQEDA